MNEKPLVSIVIPCYKQAEYLPAAIDSALAQTYAPVEIIVVNDGSPDDTEQVALGYGDRIVYIHRPNGGLPAARNTGIAGAHGRYLKFLDSDDHLHPDQIAWQMEALAGREDCVALGATRLYRDGRPEEYLDHVPQGRAFLPDLFRDYDWGGLMAWMFPTALVRAAGGFDESLRFSEDWDFLTRVGLLAPPLFVDPRIGCYYRQRAGSMSANRVGMAAARARILATLHDKLRERGRADWFGLDLLRSEQGTYQSLVMARVKERDILDPLLTRIRELQKRVGFGQFGWRFRLMARCLGYARAEQVRSFVVRALKIRAPETLDIQEWRYAT
ncbi:MAG TPA: glycosyltransferase [Gemmataceae bacterium]|nr:glycosyltransferase [Gemmataceae bacterium]